AEPSRSEREASAPSRLLGLATVKRSAAAPRPPNDRRAGAPRVQRLAATSEQSPFGVIVEDDVEPAEGQIRRSELIAQLFPLIARTAPAELASTGRTAKDCPYIERSLSFYRDQPASHIERAIAKYARPTTTDVPGLLVAVVDKVRSAVVIWIASGEVKVPAG